eukprot:91156_1
MAIPFAMLSISRTDQPTFANDKFYVFRDNILLGTINNHSTKTFYVDKGVAVYHFQSTATKPTKIEMVLQNRTQLMIQIAKHGVKVSIVRLGFGSRTALTKNNNFSITSCIQRVAPLTCCKPKRRPSAKVLISSNKWMRKNGLSSIFSLFIMDNK